MKSLTAAVLAILLLPAVVVFAVNTAIRTRYITSAPYTINVKQGVYLTINNFTQDKPGTQRGVIIAGIFPTPAPTPTPTPTPTPCTPTPCPPTPTPTPTTTPTPTPTPTPIFGTALTASISTNSPPEFIKPIIIAGPAVVTIDPVPGATLSITYQKRLQPSGITPTPAPTATPTPTVTARGLTSFVTSNSAVDVSSITSSQSVVATASGPSDDEEDYYSSTPTPTPSPTSTPKQTLSVTPTPSPIPTPLR